MRYAEKFLVITILVGIAIVGFCPKEVSGQEEAPEFSIKNVRTGKKVRLSDYEGSVVLLDFFKTGCPPCETTIEGVLVPLWESYYSDDNDVVFLSISVFESGSSLEHLRNYADERGMEWQVLRGSGSGIKEKYNLGGVPTFFVIGPEGKIRYEHVGPLGSSTLRDVIDGIKENLPEKYTLSKSTKPPQGGCIDLDPPGGTYEEGTEITASADPAQGYEFVGWTGDISGDTRTVSLVMDDDRSIIANFEDREPSEDNENENISVYLFSSKGCFYCEKMKNSVSDVLGPSKMKLYWLSDENNAQYCREIYSLVFPKADWGAPLAGVFRDGNLVAVVGGWRESYRSENFWNEVVKSEEPLGYYQGKSYEITDIDRVKSLFLRQASPESRSFVSMILPVITAAAADSVNPCALSLFIIFLIIVVTRMSRDVMKTGFSFVLGVFIIYFSLGLGLVHVFGAFSNIKYLVAAFGIFIGLLQMTNLWLDHGITLVPDRFTEEIRDRMRVGDEEEVRDDLMCDHCGPGVRDVGGGFPTDSTSEEDEGVLGKVTSPIGAFGLGVLTSALLLPCTSGPYFVAISFIPRAFFKGISLLLLYNLIFVLPFVAILVGVGKLSLQTSQVRDWWDERGKLLEFLSGLLIFGLSLYLIFFLI